MGPGGGRLDRLGRMLGVTNDNRALYVPFDNDGFVSYNASPSTIPAPAMRSARFTTTRPVTVWSWVPSPTIPGKPGSIFTARTTNLNAMNVFGGATSPWDDMPHGSVSGNSISSPTMFVGFGSDWRTTMQNYAKENTNFAPRMVWTNGVPFGWNSWGVIQQNINSADALAVSDFFHTNLENRRVSPTGNGLHQPGFVLEQLKRFSIANFVNHCHAYGQKAGIYWAVCVVWSANRFDEHLRRRDDATLTFTVIFCCATATEILNRSMAAWPLIRPIPARKGSSITISIYYHQLGI